MSNTIDNAASPILSDLSILDTNRHDGIKSSGYSMKGNTIEVKQDKSRVQGDLSMGSISFKKALNNSHNNNVNELNLILTTINKLKIDIASPLNNYSKKIKEIKKHAWSKNKQGNSQYELDDDQLDLLEATIENYIKIMLVRVQLQLLENGLKQSCRIIMFYSIKQTAEILCSQLFTAIPYINNIPQKASSEITKTYINGNKKNTKLSTILFYGGFSYTGDWLSITSKQTDKTNVIQEIHAEFNKMKIKGFALDYCIDSVEVFGKSDVKLYIPGFSKNWN